MTSLQWHRFERCAAGNAGPVCRSGQVRRPTMVPLAGIEPALSPPEGDALSAELQGLTWDYCEPSGPVTTRLPDIRPRSAKFSPCIRLVPNAAGCGSDTGAKGQPLGWRRRVDAMTRPVWPTYAAACDSPLRGSRKGPRGGYLERVGPFRMGNSTQERSGGEQKGNAMPRTEWLTVKQVCEEIGVAGSTMSEWRVKGWAPPMKKLPNSRVMCRRQDFDDWCRRLEAA